ncbi:MAG: PilN domain-containing protein [Candidatus Rifleibacteriota bacterium]
MVKRFVAVLAIIGMLTSGTVMADNCSKTGKVSKELFTGRTEYQNLRTCLDQAADIFSELDVKYYDTRVSPIIMTEQWLEIPIELGWMSTETTLAPVFEKLLAYSFGLTRLGQYSMAISCSAENDLNGKPFLSITSQKKLFIFRSNDKDSKASQNDLWASISKQNQQIVRSLKSLLKVTTFTPQIRKAALGKGLGNGKTWLTNLRIDGDNRVQFTGYALDAKEVTRLGEELYKTGAFVEVYLSCMNKNVYEKVPVWRFDFSAKVH